MDVLEVMLPCTSYYDGVFRHALTRQIPNNPKVLIIAPTSRPPREIQPEFLEKTRWHITCLGTDSVVLSHT